ncbi:MAG TPA: YraN family protein [Solimonas sp.]|nr:YraN family protein [Solimonas sp.]
MTGAEAEDAALRLLQRAGLRLVTRNFRARGGELDLVMLDGDTLVVAEVRARAGAAFGGALESVDARKCRRIILAAQLFLAAHPEHASRPLRFDVVAYEGASPARWLRGAFDGF